MQVLVDTGATRCFISARLAKALMTDIEPLTENISFNLANKSNLLILGGAHATLNICDKIFSEHFIVTNSLVHDVILGGNFIWKHKVDILTSVRELRIGDVAIPIYASNEISNKAESLAAIEECSPGDLVNINRELSAEQTAALKSLFNRFSDVCSQDPEDIGESTFTHRIELTSKVPVVRRGRRIAHTERKIVEDETSKMLRMGVIQPSKSPYGAPVVLVNKKDNAARFCVDYRGLNEITVKDNYPMPYIEEELERFRGCRYFTTLDLTSGYWQFLVEDSAQKYTAFSTHEGHFEFKRMPFGLCTAGATFQRNMEELLKGLEFARNYIDDIMVASKTFEEHLKHLELVLTRLREAKLKVKPTKCNIADHETKFLGFLVSEKGIKVCDSRSDAIKDYPIPTTQKQVRSFLGLASYYRRFINGFSEMAAPLTALTAKAAKGFKWNEICDEAFNNLKERLISPPILRQPDFQRQFVLTTDASTYGLGAILSQPDGDQENVIAYASRTMNEHERRYMTTEQELLAIVWAVQRFRPYLYGTTFKLITDHKALVHIQTSALGSGRLARWKLLLAEYQFEVEHKPGKDNTNADVLSRIEYVSSIYENAPMTSEELARLQGEDKNLKAIIDKTNEGGGVYESFVLRDGVLYRRRSIDKPYAKNTIWRLVIPDSLVDEVLRTCHDDFSGAHLGLKKTCHKVSSQFFWTGMKKDVEKWISSCELCDAKKLPVTKYKAPLHPITEAERPFDIIGMDFVGPLPETESGNKWLLVITDYLTKWVEAFPTKDAKANTVAKILIKEIICRHGAPKKLLTDQGRQFVSNLLAKVCEYFNTKKINTTSYHPQCNGLTERFNGTLCSMIASYCNEKQEDWDEFIDVCLFAYRTSKQETVGETPFRLLYGRDVNLPADIALWSSKDIFIDEIDKAWKLAHKLISESAERQVAKESISNYPKYKVGDRIRVDIPSIAIGLKRKLRRKNYSEPLEVLAITDTDNIMISRDPDKWVHSNRVKPAITSRYGRVIKQPDRYQAGFD